MRTDDQDVYELALKYLCSTNVITSEQLEEALSTVGVAPITLGDERREGLELYLYGNGLTEAAVTRVLKQLERDTRWIQFKPWVTVTRCTVITRSRLLPTRHGYVRELWTEPVR